MNDAEILESTSALLNKYHKLGLEQIERYKKLNPGNIRRTKVNGQEMGEYNGIFMPIEDVIRRIGMQEDVFIVMLLQGFWDYYLLNTNNIEFPARQGIDRTLMEVCYQKLIPFARLSESKKKRVILITNLSDIGMILDQPSDQDLGKVPGYTKDYDFWCEQLSKQTDKDHFLKLKEDGYPTHEFALTKNKMWPNFYNAYTENESSIIFPWSGDEEENIIRARTNFLRQYQQLHDFVHGSHLSAITALEAEETKNHLFRSCAIAFQVGYQVLDTVNNEYIVTETVDLNEVYLETGEIIQKLKARFSHIGDQV